VIGIDHAVRKIVVEQMTAIFRLREKNKSMIEGTFIGCGSMKVIGAAHPTQSSAQTALTADKTSSKQDLQVIMK